MLGAIVGDIVGSVYEWNNIKIKNCNLLVAVKHRFTSVPFRNLYFHFQA